MKPYQIAFQSLAELDFYLYNSLETDGQTILNYGKYVAIKK